MGRKKIGEMRRDHCCGTTFVDAEVDELFTLCNETNESVSNVLQKCFRIVTGMPDEELEKQLKNLPEEANQKRCLIRTWLCAKDFDTLQRICSDYGKTQRTVLRNCFRIVAKMPREERKERWYSSHGTSRAMEDCMTVILHKETNRRNQAITMLNDREKNALYEICNEMDESISSVLRKSFLIVLRMSKYERKEEWKNL